VADKSIINKRTRQGKGTYSKTVVVIDYDNRIEHRSVIDRYPSFDFEEGLVRVERKLIKVK